MTTIGVEELNRIFRRSIGFMLESTLVKIPALSHKMRRGRGTRELTLFDRVQVAPVEYSFGSNRNISLGQSNLGRPDNEGNQAAWQIIFRR
jgi:hypothetical protein